MKTSYYLVPAACIVAAAVTFHTQSSGRSGARELPAVPVATVPLTAQAPPPFGVENVQLPPVVSPPSHFVVPVAAPLAIPAAPTTPVEPTPVPTIPTVPLPATPAALPALPATPAMLPAMPAVTPAVSIVPVPTAPPVVPVNPPKPVPAPPVAAPVPVVPVIPAPAATPTAPVVPVVPVTPAVPVVPVVPATPTVPAPAPAPTAPSVAPATPIIPATPVVPVLVPPEGVQPTPKPAPAPQPPQPMLLPAPTPLPVPSTPAPITQPDTATSGDGSAPTPSKFILLKPNKLVEGSVTVTGEKAVLRQGSLERSLPKTDVLYVGETKDEIYKFVLAQVSPTDAAARVGVARWLMFAGLREQALTEAREILKLQPGNTNAAGIARSLEESLKHFPVDGTQVVAAKPAAGTLVSAEREADVTAEGAATFALRAQPVLANQCMDCHARPDYPGAFKLIRVTGFEVGPQSTKANLRATAAQLKKDDPLSAPLLAKALTQHGGMKQPAFVSRLAPGYRTLEAWVALATPALVSPMNAPTQPTLPPQVVVQPMPQPSSPVLPMAEEVPPIPQAEPLLVKPAVPPAAPPATTDPLLPPVPTPSIPPPMPRLDPEQSLPIPSVDPQEIPAPTVPVPVAPLPSIPATQTPAIPEAPLPSIPATPVPSTPALPVPDVALPTLPMVPAGTPTLPAPPAIPAVPAPSEMIPAGPPPILPTPASLPQIEAPVKSPELPAAPPAPSAPKSPAKPKPTQAPAPSQFGTGAPPKTPATGPAGGDEFDPANFNLPK